jgi:DNA-binding PadR family transcriptional regulator
MLKNGSDLEHALLGLLHGKPMSGYDLRKTFASTPLKHFSQSPGAIYPALKRLERRNLIKGQVEAKTALRPRKLFQPTFKGLRELRTWLAMPATTEDVIWRLDVLMLRFSFMSEMLEPGEIVRFLRSLAAELSAYMPTLKQHYEKHAEAMPRSGRLALKAGIGGYESHLRFVNEAIAEFEQLEKSTGSAKDRPQEPAESRSNL